MIVESLRNPDELWVAELDYILEILLSLDCFILSLGLNFVNWLFQLSLACDLELGQILLDPLANKLSSVSFEPHLFFCVFPVIPEIGVYFVFNQVDVQIH